jgi:hypothetical protein
MNRSIDLFQWYDSGVVTYSMQISAQLSGAPMYYGLSQRAPWDQRKHSEGLCCTVKELWHGHYAAVT